jgi:hypothetical protein
MITEDRMMVVQAVIDGNLPYEHVTLEEVTEVLSMLHDLVQDREKQRRPLSFAGLPSNMIH